jgi:hypothetical protein
MERADCVQRSILLEIQVAKAELPETRLSHSGKAAAVLTRLGTRDEVSSTTSPNTILSVPAAGERSDQMIYVCGPLLLLMY